MRRLLTVLAAAVLAAAACGGDTAATSAAGPAASTTTAPDVTTQAPTTAAPATTAAVTTTSPEPVPTLVPEARSRAEVPWDAVDESWAVALLSTSPGYGDAEPIGEQQVIAYLVDPNGVRYRIADWAAADGPYGIYDVRPDGQRALLVPGVGDPWLLDLPSGELIPVPFPTDAMYFAFTRPTGRDYLALTYDGEIAMYSSDGSFMRMLGRYLEEEDFHFGPQQPWVFAPDGLGLVVNGELGPAYTDNRGTHLADLSVPGERLCRAVSWWDDVNVLMRCLAAGDPIDVFQLWVVDSQGEFPPLPVTEPEEGAEAGMEQAWAGFVHAIPTGVDVILQGWLEVGSGWSPIYKLVQGVPAPLGDEVAGDLIAAGPTTFMTRLVGCCGEVYGALIVFDHDGNELARLDAPEGYRGVIDARGVGAP